MCPIIRNFYCKIFWILVQTHGKIYRVAKWSKYTIHTLVLWKSAMLTAFWVQCSLASQWQSLVVRLLKPVHSYQGWQSCLYTFNASLLLAVTTPYTPTMTYSRQNFSRKGQKEGICRLIAKTPASRWSMTMLLTTTWISQQTYEQSYHAWSE